MALGRNAAEPLCRLVRFETADGADTLAGALYEPARKSTGAALFLHGAGGSSVFESRRTNVLGELFTSAGIAYFPFNNRGAQVIRRFGRGYGGSAYERIRDCVADIDGAVRELRRRGYRDLTLIGHSTGANKIAVYDHYKPRNFIKRYVLLAGGDDTGMAFDHLGARRFAAALVKARAMIRAKRGDELVPAGLSAMEPITWGSYYDLANPDGDYNVFPFLELIRGVRLSKRPRFRYVKAIRKPALFLYGDRDQYAWNDVSRCVAILADALGPKPNVELAVMDDADHSFTGRERELAELLIDWIVG